ncbi:MAG: 2-oxo-4-hydroxy-4-carboxy-5-ureidoimidazoline decarboxylase [Casimicrobiaceae bacterium]
MESGGEPRIKSHRVQLRDLNAAPPERFIATLGDIFEHSPWVAERVLPDRPFADVAALHAAMMRRVEDASAAEKLTLLCAHPELAGREAQQGSLTAASAVEQERAGLNALTRAEMARITALNAAYRAHHGFPFIVCVGHHTKDSLMRNFEQRASSSTDVEMTLALQQVAAIARLRLDRLLAV